MITGKTVAKAFDTVLEEDGWGDIDRYWFRLASTHSPGLMIDQLTFDDEQARALLAACNKVASILNKQL